MRRIRRRPRHLKNFLAAVAEIAAGPAKGKVIEIWFQDEARIGQKNKITRRWAKRGSRPSAPHDQRTRSAYIFGAICPKQGKAAALVMPWCETDLPLKLHPAAIRASAVLDKPNGAMGATGGNAKLAHFVALEPVAAMIPA